MLNLVEGLGVPCDSRDVASKPNRGPTPRQDGYDREEERRAAQIVIVHQPMPIRRPHSRARYFPGRLLLSCSSLQRWHLAGAGWGVAGECGGAVWWLAGSAALPAWWSQWPGVMTALVQDKDTDLSCRLGQDLRRR